MNAPIQGIPNGTPFPNGTLSSHLVPDWVKEAAPKQDGILCKASLFSKFPPAEPVGIDDETIKDLTLKIKTLQCFPVGSTWSNKHELFQCLKQFGSYHNILINTGSSKHFVCSRSGTATGDTSQRCECPFKLDIAAVFSSPPQTSEVNESKNKSSRAKSTTPRNPQRKQLFDSVIVITKVEGAHNHQPTAQQFLASMKKAGNFTKHLSDNTIFLLIQLSSSSPTLPIKVVRPILENASPQCKIWTSQDINNVRIKIRYLKQILGPDQTHSFESFARSFKNEEFDSYFSDHNSEET